MRKLLIGTGNKGKLEEFRSLIDKGEFELIGLGDLPPVEEPEETGTTFEENAWLKARYYSEHFGLPTIADDSGLSVDYLDGAPGVISARFAGENATDSENLEKLLDLLEGVEPERRKAKFVCVLVFIDPDADSSFSASGECLGSISAKPNGINGFGYDPIFVPDGYSDSFGILSENVKKKLSHRAVAARKINAFLKNNSKNPT